MRRAVRGVGILVLVVGGLGLCACGSTGGGSVALGAGQAARGPTAIMPSGSVLLVPLDPALTAVPTPGTGGGAGAGTGGGTGPGGGQSGSGSAALTPEGSPSPQLSPGSVPTSAGGVRPAGDRAAGSAASASPPARTRTSASASASTAPAPPTTPGPTASGSAPLSPAALSASAPTTGATAHRWCQNVTLALTNSGGQAATAAMVTFSTHVIGSLGVDWWTYATSQPLRAPVPGHASATESWTVCLDDWQVPAGMHMETRAASVSSG